MKRLPRWTALLTALAGATSTACVVPIELVDDGDSGAVDGSGDVGSGDDGSGDSASASGGSADADTDGDDSDSGGCIPGAPGCVCDPDGSCDDGHACADQQCVPLEGNCGNGVMDTGEACDDGNLTDADGCNADCRVSGAEVWSAEFADADGSRSWATAVAVDSADAVVFGGRRSLDELSTGWVRKLDASGDVLWADALPENISVDALATGPDDRIVAGCSESTEGGFGFDSMWMRSYGADGTIEQSVSENWDAALAVGITPAGVVLAGGTGRVYAYDSDATWFVDLQDGWINAMAVRPTGGFVVAGYASEVAETSWIAWYDSADAGAEPSQTTLTPGDAIEAIALDGQGNVLAVGGEWQSSPHTWLRKLGPDGAELWTRELDSVGNPLWSNAVAVDSHDRVIVAGWAGYIDNEDIRLEKYDADGFPLWTVIDEDETDGLLHGVAINSRDEIVVVGEVGGVADEGHTAWVATYTP